jgi:hypothetical protein
MYSPTGAGRTAVPAGARAFRRFGAGALASAAICAAAAGCATGAGSTASGGGSAAASGQGAAASALSLAATQAGKITSYTATVSMTTTGPAASSMNSTVEMQNKPTLIIHEKISGTGGEFAALGGAGMEMILTRTTIYMKMGLLSKMVGKPWVKLDFSKANNSAPGLNLSSLFSQAQTSNPLAEAQLFASSTNVHQVGTATINGVPTTEYTGTYHIGAGLNRLSPDLRKQMQQALSATGMTTSRFSIWVDGQHNVRKLVQTETGSAGTSVTTTMLVTSIDQPVTVQLPPASQVAGMPGL